MMNPIRRETTGLCVTRQQEGEAAVNGSPTGSGDKCSEQVPGMGVTSMLLPPRAPGARTGAHVPMRAWAGRRWGIQEPRQQTAQALWMIYIKAPSSQFNMGLLKL